MVTAALRQIENLLSQLDTIDPATDVDAGDRIAAMAVALRDTLARSQATPGAAESDTRNLQAL
jgi:hypothetical protein